MAKRNMLGCSQFGRLKQCQTIGVEDRISGLPDEILSHILTWLTLKEVISTSILSKRWEKLWVSHSNLDFECFRLTQPDTYVQIVDKILRQYNGPKLNKLRIGFPWRESFSHHIEDWISSAIRNGVSEVDLDLVIPFGRLNNYYVAAHVFGGEVMMNTKTSHCFSLHTTSPNVGKHFGSLRELRLRSVNLSNEVFDLILSNCFSLEKFLLMLNHGLVNAKVSAPHLKLKSLELYLCKDLEYLQLSAPNLISFRYYGRERTLCIKDAKQLASLRLTTCTFGDPNTSLIFPRGKSFIFSQFSVHLPKIKSLVISAHLFTDLSDFTELCAFCNLKQLVLDVTRASCTQLGYRVVASIIRAAPFLELLEISLLPMDLNPRNPDALELAPMSPHQNLKEVKVFGFRGDDSTVKFLAYLIEYAVSLQKIDITALGAVRSADELNKLVGFLDWNTDEAERSKNFVMQLRQTLHPNTQLLFHDG